MNFTTGSGRTAGNYFEDPRFRGKRYRQLVAGFNVYRVSPIAAESVPPPRIHTAFRGVPFSSRLSVVSVAPRDVTFAMEKLQAKAVARTGTSVIMSPLHGLSFKVTATGVDPAEGRASFANFLTQHRGGKEKRTNLRVEPEHAIEVQLKCLDRELRGRLHDISVVSLAVSIAESEVDGLAAGDPVRVRIPELAPVRDLSVEARGRIIRTTRLTAGENQAFDVVIYLQIDHRLYDRLKRYVDVRRIALIRELAGLQPAANGSPPG